MQCGSAPRTSTTSSPCRSAKFINVVEQQTGTGRPTEGADDLMANWISAVNYSTLWSPTTTRWRSAPSRHAQGRRADDMSTMIPPGIATTQDALAAMKLGDLDVTVFQDGAGKRKGAVDAALRLEKAIQTVRSCGVAPGELQRGVDRALALTGRVLEHGDVEVPRLMAASASWVASTPATMTSSMSTAGGLERLDGADRHFVVVGDHGVELDAGADTSWSSGRCPAVRDQLAVCSSTILMNEHSGVAITSWMSWVRWRAAWLESSPIMTTILASLPASVSRRQTSLVSQRAGIHFVGADEGLVVAAGVEVDGLAVDVDQRDAGLGGELSSWPRSRRYRPG